MSDSDSKGSTDRAGPCVPKGVLSTRGRGIDVDEEKSRPTVSKGPVAVDLQQFQNFEVGKGYQAQHVVRQPQAASGSVKILDMSRQNKTTKDETLRRSRHSSDKKESKDVKTSRLQRYLRSAAFRRFRRELEKIK